MLSRPATHSGSPGGMRWLYNPLGTAPAESQPARSDKYPLVRISVAAESQRATLSVGKGPTWSTHQPSLGANLRTSSIIKPGRSLCTLASFPKPPESRSVNAEPQLQNPARHPQTTSSMVLQRSFCSETSHHSLAVHAKPNRELALVPVPLSDWRRDNSQQGTRHARVLLGMTQPGRGGHALGPRFTGFSDLQIQKLKCQVLNISSLQGFLARGC